MKVRSTILLLSGMLLVSLVPASLALEASQAGMEPPKLRVLLGKSLIVNSDEPLRRVSVSDPRVASALIITERQVLIHGLRAGIVSLILWTQEEQPRTFDLEVLLDLARAREVVRRIVPDEPIEVSQTGGALILTGTVSSPVAVSRAGAVAATQSNNVVNLLAVAENRDMVLLQVRFAEVDRQRSREFGFNIFSTGGVNTFGTLSTQQFGPPAVSGTVGGAIGAPLSGSTGEFRIQDLLNVFLFRTDINLGLTIRALEQQNLLQILAEPNILALNGQEASFLAGGEFPFPVIQGGQSNAITIQFREFGIRLIFTPEIQLDGLIRLTVLPEVSSLDFANAVSISGFLIPALSTRRAETQIELRDGQSFAIAGLLDNRLIKTASKIPLLGDIPVLGKLFRSYSIDKNNSELLVTVTPHLVNALEVDQLPEGPNFPIPFMDVERWDETVGKEKAEATSGGS